MRIVVVDDSVVVREFERELEGRPGDKNLLEVYAVRGSPCLDGIPEDFGIYEGLDAGKAFIIQHFLIVLGPDFQLFGTVLVHLGGNAVVNASDIESDGGIPPEVLFVDGTDVQIDFAAFVVVDSSSDGPFNRVISGEVQPVVFLDEQFHAVQLCPGGSQQAFCPCVAYRDEDCIL